MRERIAHPSLIQTRRPSDHPRPKSVEDATKTFWLKRLLCGC